MPAWATDKPIEVWFQDEARVGQKGSIEYVWAPIGSRPPMVRDNRHDSVHIFGAICPARGVGAAIIMPGVNTEAMNEHLAEISTQVTAGAHCLLVCDGAGWHQKGERLIIPDNITLLPLPPYRQPMAISRKYMKRIRRFLLFLAGRGVIPAFDKAASDSIDPHVAEFQDWLRRHRGICNRTIVRHGRMVMRLLPALGRDPRSYDAASIRRAILSVAPRQTSSQCQTG